MKFTPGHRGIVISSRTAAVAFVECDSCSGELWNQVVLAVNHAVDCERITHPNSLHPCDCGAVLP